MTAHITSPSAASGPENPQPDDATVKMPSLVPQPPAADEEDDENFDPDSTLVREDWESTVIRRVAPHVAAVQSQVAEDSMGENRFGWESAGLRRLAHEVQKTGGQ